MSFFRIRVLPAGHGDCIVIEYGEDPSAPNRVLIDGGTIGTAKRIEKLLPPKERQFELFVVTHVDSDHIGGAVRLLEKPPAGFAFDEIWFNGYRHLSGLEEQGPVQGERLTTLLWPQLKRWNKAFDGGPICVPAAGALQTKKLGGGLLLTILSPTLEKLAALKPVWERICAAEDLDPQVKPPDPVEGLEPMGAIDVTSLAAEPFAEDSAPANGSSIAFLAEYGGKRVLFGADAHPGVLEGSIARLPGGRVTVDAFKLPHHGSRNNVSTGLLALVSTRRYLFSTNGAHFKHPHREAVARVIAQLVPQCEVRFNYANKYTSPWDDEALRKEWGFVPTYPKAAESGDDLTL